MIKNYLTRKTLEIVFVIFTTFLSPAYCAFSQNSKVITGTVSDNSSNIGISGVSVVIKGSSRGVTTNANGKYTIQAGANDTLAFSAIGYQGREEPVNNQSVIAISMSRNSTLLQSVTVNVGYGSQRRVDVTGAVTSISSKEITELPLTNFQQALQGRAPGIDVVANGTSPGSGVTVRIRGRRSILASNDPLYVLDGIPISGDLTDINPNDIESMDVLKDASATAIYGSRGANGGADYY